MTGKQLQAVRLSTARIVAYEGAVRSSKTICSLLSWLEFIRTGPPGNLLMAGRTERTLKRNCLDPLIEMVGPKRCRVVSGSGEAWIMGRRVYLVGANDERSGEKLRGLSLVGSLADECSTMPESFFSMLLTRMSQKGSRVWITSNPEGPEHWLKKNFLDKARLHLTRDGDTVLTPCTVCGQQKCGPDCDGDGNLDLHRFSFQLSDNPSLTPEYRQQIASSLSGLHYRRWILGDWCLAEGTVYDMFDRSRHVITGPLPPMVRIVGAGVDVGTVNPTAALLLGVQAPDREAGTPARLVLMREFRFDSSKSYNQKTDAELSRDVRTWLGQDRPEWIAVDPSAASFKVQLFRDGISNVMDAKNAVVDGIRLVSSLLATGQLVIHESCTGLLTELGSYSWDPRAQKHGEDKPLKVNDHSADAARYAIATTETLWRPYVRASYAA